MEGIAVSAMLIYSISGKRFNLFSAAIEHALATNTQERVKEGLALAMQNSCEERAEEFSCAIESLLGAKS